MLFKKDGAVVGCDDRLKDSVSQRKLAVQQRGFVVHQRLGSLLYGLETTPLPMESNHTKIDARDKVDN